jgi:hypothetical protein
MKPYMKFSLIFTAIAVIFETSCNQKPGQPVDPVTITGNSMASPSPQPKENTLQLGNDHSSTILSPKSSINLEDNRIGGNAQTIHIDSRYWDAGLKWMRVILDPMGEWQYADWNADEYAIDPDAERVIDGLVTKGIKVMLVLDVWLTEERTINYKTEEEIAIFSDWVRFVVRQFKGRVDYYEILNEPNLDLKSPSGMPVPAYVNLVQRVVPIIREEDPGAKIVVGAVPDTRFHDARNWIWDLLDSGIMPFVDGLSWHGMYGAAPSGDNRGNRQLRHPQVKNYWENYPEYIEEIKTVAASNGFKGEFMTEEMLWRTPDMPHETEPDRFTDISAAKYYARAIIIHLGHNVAPGLALPPDDDMPRAYSIIQALSTIMAGAKPADLSVAIESELENIKYYSFDLSNGDKLLAIWSDDTAVDNDPGVSTILKFEGYFAQNVIAIDALEGIQQELIIEIQPDNILIPHLLVKDYPIILQFTDATSP